MSTKPQRWYIVDGDVAFVYDSHNPETATSVAVVSAVNGLAYYRREFNLSRAWCRASPVSDFLSQTDVDPLS